MLAAGPRTYTCTISCHLVYVKCKTRNTGSHAKAGRAVQDGLSRNVAQRCDVRARDQMAFRNKRLAALRFARQPGYFRAWSQ